jgi:DNA-binding IclR family transcriptional regulator
MSSERTGTQSIERSIGLMRALALRPRLGWSLSDLAAYCAIDKGTARRILNCLVRERIAARSPSGLRYLPGPMLFELGLALPQLDNFRSTALPMLWELADETQTLAFLCLRSGDDIVCVARVGDVPTRDLTLKASTRRPMSKSASGAVFLVASPQQEREAIFERNCVELARSGCSRDVLERVLHSSLEAGMGYNEGCFVPTWNSYALPLRNASEAWASVMISAPKDAFTSGRRDSCLRALRNMRRRMQDAADGLFEGHRAFADHRALAVQVR